MRDGRSASRLPDQVTLEVVEAEPVVKGQTAASSYKPAKLENGVRILVPPFVGAASAWWSTPTSSLMSAAPSSGDSLGSSLSFRPGKPGHPASGNARI